MLSEVREQTEGIRFLRRVVEGHLTTPLLFVGTEGVGRRFSVTEAAKEAFSGGASESIHCVQINQGAHPDFVLVQPEGDKDISVDTIRQVVEQAYSFPAMVPSRYVVIDGADRMTIAAANALLKTLEEPPKTTRFFLLAQSAESVIPTIRSRCGLVRFRPLSESFIVKHLEPIEKDPTIALVYARLAEGSVGRAVQFRLTNRLGLRDRMLALLKTCLGRDLSSLFSAVTTIDRKDLSTCLQFLEHLLHDLIMIDYDPALISNLDCADEVRSLSTRIGVRRSTQLIEGLRLVRSRARRAKLNLPFHIQTLLANTFSE